MKLTFKNLGPVNEAIIDLTKRLNILCGPNNTGKTYIAYCIYGISKSPISGRFSKLAIKELSSIIQNGKVQINLFEKYKQFKTLIKQLLERNFLNNISSIFGIDKKSVEKSFASTELTVTLQNDDDFINSLKEAKINETIKIANLTFKIDKKIGSEYLNIVMASEADLKQPQISDFYLDFLSHRILESLVRQIIPSAYIAPVERNSIYTFSKELAIKRNILVDQILDLKSEKSRTLDPFDLVERRATRYPLPVRDGLEISEDLNNFKKNEGAFAFFGEQLENELLNGKVSVTKEGEIVFSPNKAKTLKLPIHLTASIVKSLSSLVLYFKHLATEGDFIIIDEPELNLHPDSQILIARIIALIVNQGFKVLINTHSDYIIRELNNLIMLSNVSSDFDEYERNYNYTKQHKIDPSFVGAYLFSYNKTKVTVQQLDVSGDGFEVSTIDKVINDLNERSQDLFFKLNERDDK